MQEMCLCFSQNVLYSWLFVVFVARKSKSRKKTETKKFPSWPVVLLQSNFRFAYTLTCLLQHCSMSFTNCLLVLMLMLFTTFVPINWISVNLLIESKFLKLLFSFFCWRLLYQFSANSTDFVFFLLLFNKTHGDKSENGNKHGLRH